MKVSVIICTHNRYESLLETLQSLISQDYPVSDYEVIIVDNNSSDNTKDVVNEYVEKSKKKQGKSYDYNLNQTMQVRYVVEEKIGLSHARNRGITNAQGDIVAFIDDDAKADRFWLSKLLQVYDDEKDAGCVGGRVIPLWRIPKPPWWHPDLDAVINSVDHGRYRIAMTHRPYPIGTNISFRMDTIKDVGRFRIDIGRAGSKLLAGEEMELCTRIAKAGYKIYYEPSAIVYHTIAPGRLTKSYIRKWAFWHGRSNALIDLEHLGSKYVRERIIIRLIRIIIGVLKFKYSINEQKKYLILMGYIVEGIRKSF